MLPFFIPYTWLIIVYVASYELTFSYYKCYQNDDSGLNCFTAAKHGHSQLKIKSVDGNNRDENGAMCNGMLEHR